MARKKRKKKHVSQAQQLAIAHRELEKGNAKQAVKHAKACYRLDPSESARSLLQRALLSRGRKLHARAMHEPARAVVVELDELGEVAADYQADANRLRALLGLRGDLNSPELLEDKSLRDELADQAVLLGPVTTRLGATMADTAAAVRAALAAAETGQHERAIELVASIGRDSPYCDWKLLVRGLCAYYEYDDQRAVANWSRLAPERPARRIADTLLLLTESRHCSDAPGLTRARADQLIRSIETPMLGSLRVLQRKLRDSDCEPPELRAELRRFMKAYAEKEPAVAQRVADIFIRRAIKQEDGAGLAALKRFLPKLPLDPNLNRANALLAEFQGDLSLMEQYWKAYANDLRTCEALHESQKATAAALVYNHVATDHVKASEEAEDAPGFMHNDDEYIASLQQDAVFYFRKSLDANPNLPDVHVALGKLLEKRGQHKEAAVTFHELGRRFPDDAEPLIAVASHFVASNEPGVAKEYAKKARTLRPRDAQTLTLVWGSCLGTAREAAKCCQFRLAEAELDEAETLLGAGTLDAYILHAMRAAVALKEGHQEGAERHVNKTIEQFEQPTAALLLVDSQARRCNVAAKDIKALEDRLAKALKGRKNAQAAGVMAKYLHALAVNDIDYRGLVTHTKQVETYLKQCRRVKWQVDHLLDACRFASLESERQPLLEKLAKRGTAMFPDHPVFHFFVGRAEMARGPSGCNYQAARYAFGRAIELGKAGDVPLEESYCRIASRSLSLLEGGRPPSFSPHGPFDFGFDSDADDDEDDDAIGVDGAFLKHLLATMPADLKRELEKQGVNPLDAVRVIAGKMGGDLL